MIKKKEAQQGNAEQQKGYRRRHKLRQEKDKKLTAKRIQKEKYR